MKLRSAGLTASGRQPGDGLPARDREPGPSCPGPAILKISAPGSQGSGLFAQAPFAERQHRERAALLRQARDVGALAHAEREPAAGNRCDRLAVDRDERSLTASRSMVKPVAVAPLMMRSRTRPPFSTCTISGSSSVRSLARIGVIGDVVEVHPRHSCRPCCRSSCCPCPASMSRGLIMAP